MDYLKLRVTIDNDSADTMVLYSCEAFDFLKVINDYEINYLEFVEGSDNTRIQYGNKTIYITGMKFMVYNETKKPKRLNYENILSEEAEYNCELVITCRDYDEDFGDKYFPKSK